MLSHRLRAARVAGTSMPEPVDSCPAGGAFLLDGVWKQLGLDAVITGFADTVGAVDEDACYRVMDWLTDAGEALERAVYEQVADLLNLEVDLLFFDTTSTYFETEGPISPSSGVFQPSVFRGRRLTARATASRSSAVHRDSTALIPPSFPSTRYESPRQISSVASPERDLRS